MRPSFRRFFPALRLVAAKPVSLKERTIQKRNGHTRLLWCSQCNRYWDWYERVTITDRFPFLTDDQKGVGSRHDEEKLKLAVTALLWNASFRDVTEARKWAGPQRVSADFYEAVREWLFQWFNNAQFLEEIVTFNEEWTPHLVETAIKFLREEQRAAQLDSTARVFCDELKHTLPEKRKLNADEVALFHRKRLLQFSNFLTALDKVWDESKPTTTKPFIFTPHPIRGFNSPLRRVGALGRKKVG